MSLLRTAARGMLASVFIYGGIDTLRNPAPQVAAAEDVVDELADRIEQIPHDAETVVKANAALQIVAGLGLATNTFARPSSLALAGSLVPTTAAAHAFWELDDQASRKTQLLHFLKNLGLLGGLLITALDTQGEPGVAWRAQHAVEHAGLLADHKREVAGLQTELVKEKARAATIDKKAKVKAGAKQASHEVQMAAATGWGLTRGARGAGRTAKRLVSALLPF
ncbi:DoxX family membrane protein [soil metagenome]